MSTEVAVADPNVGSVDQFERSGLDAPPGVFRFRLAGVYGLQETQNGKRFINVRFILDQEALYDEAGDLLEVVDLKRPHSLFHKFWIESDYGNQQFNSWLRAVGQDITGTFDQATQSYVFLKDVEIAKTVDRTAFNRVRHTKDETYGWQIDLQRDFRTKPQARIKVNSEASNPGAAS